MSERKINLSKILEAKNKLAFEEGYSNYFTAAQRNIIFKAMEESIKQAIELASENANLQIFRLNMNSKNDCETLIEREYTHCEYNQNGSDYNVNTNVNEQSILNTLEQIEYY